MEHDAELEALELRLFLEAIYSRYGYDFRGYNQASMTRRLQAVLVKLGKRYISELQHEILRDASLFSTVLDDLTVRTSDMFRDPTFFRAIRRTLVPVLRTYPLLRVWHAGCAGGEEVYSLAILLTEEGLYDRAQIYATDLSTQALDQARQGFYSAEHLPAYEENYRHAGGSGAFESYYTHAYDGIAMKEALRKNILFFHHNLISDHPFAEMHLIFCRNLLIYLGPDFRLRVLKKFSASLAPGGFFCVGSSERLPMEQQAVFGFDELDPDERIYRHAQ
jgi:chemotaxis protein methyltransferase CheR